jgi:hypothetical protein
MPLTQSIAFRFLSFVDVSAELFTVFTYFFRFHFAAHATAFFFAEPPFFF